jgi:hypothetical protein
VSPQATCGAPFSSLAVTTATFGIAVMNSIVSRSVIAAPL